MENSLLFIFDEIWPETICYFTAIVQGLYKYLLKYVYASEKFIKSLLASCTYSK